MRCSSSKPEMKKTTSADLSHVSSGVPDGRRVGVSRNPVGMTDLQRRLMAGKAGLLELALLRESHRRLVEEAKKILEDQSRRAAETLEHKGSRRSRRSVSESGDGAPESSSSDDDEDDEDEEGDSSSIDDVFYTNPILSNLRNINSNIINTRLLATAPSRFTSTSSNKTKPRRMSEFQCRGVAHDGKSSFCRTFNGIRLTAHRRRSEGTFLGVQHPARLNRDICLTDSFRKPVVTSGLTFTFPSPLHAVLSQFDLTRVRCSVGPDAGHPCPLEGGSEGSTVSTIRQGKGMGFQGNGLVRRRVGVTRGSESTLILAQRTRERLAVSESSLLLPQRRKVRLGEIASVHTQGQKLFSKTLEQEDLGEDLTTVPSASSNVEEGSSEDNPKKQDLELERSSSEEKEPEEQSRGFDLSKEAVARPRLSRTALCRLSEEGYFSGSDSQPSTIPEAPPLRRGMSGSKTSPKQSISKESSNSSSNANSAEHHDELKQDTGSGPCSVQSETKIETVPSERLPERLPVFC